MTKELKIALAQINPTVGNIVGNLDLIRAARKECSEIADILITGELAVSGYPPEDLVLKPTFLDMIEKKINDLALETTKSGPAVLLGAPWRENNKLYNAALLLENGKTIKS